MILAFDAKRFTHNGTGLGNYSRFLLKALAETYPERLPIVYTLFGQAGFVSPPHGSFSVTSVYSAVCLEQKFAVCMAFGGHAERCWARWGRYLPWPLSNELPYSIHCKIPTLLTVHDLIYVRYSEFYKPIDRWIYKRKLSQVCRASRSYRGYQPSDEKEIGDFFDIQPDKIEVVYQRL